MARESCSKRSQNSQTTETRKRERRNKRDHQTITANEKQEKLADGNLGNHELSNKYKVTLANIT
jgi:hypothetical protein